MVHLGDPCVRLQLLRRLAALATGRTAVVGQNVGAPDGVPPHRLLPRRDGLEVRKPGDRPLAAHRDEVGRALRAIPWPKGVPTRPEVEQGAGGTPPLEFTRDRADLVHLMETFSDAQRRFEWTPHPVFGAMREREWLRWGYLHVDHHLRQFDCKVGQTLPLLLDLPDSQVPQPEKMPVRRTED